MPDLFASLNLVIYAYTSMCDLCYFIDSNTDLSANDIYTYRSQHNGIKFVVMAMFVKSFVYALSKLP